MTPDSLTFFLHLSETLHFGRSAKALHMSPSSLTRAIQRLEEYVGQPLLQRDRRNVSLTPAGLRFRRFALEQRRAWEHLQTDLRATHGVPSGQLKIACTVTACYSLLPQLIANCREKYPDITLELTTQNAAQALRSLQAALVDFAVLPLPRQLPEGLDACALGFTSLIFVAPRRPRHVAEALQGDPIPWREIPVVAPLEGLDRQRLQDWLSQLPEQPTIRTEVAGNEGILSMVSLGCGMALVPQLVWERSPLKNDVVVIDSLAAPPGYDVGLCARRQSLPLPAVRAFWQLAQPTQHGDNPLPTMPATDAGEAGTSAV